MRENRLFQLYDKKAQTASGPIMAAHLPAPFVREFKRLLGDTTTDVGKYPEDFELREIGTQDLTTCEITAFPPQTIYSGAQWLADRETSAALHIASQS